MKLLLILIAIIFSLASCSTTTKLERNSPECQNLIGVWIGENVYEDTQTHSRYRSEHSVDGGLKIDFNFHFKDGTSKSETYTGSWECENNILITTTTDESGTTKTFGYIIIEINSQYMRYQNFNGEALGPVFEAMREK